MLIDQDKCIGCRKCVPYCTAGAIYIEGKKAKINLDECVECGVCYRVKVCPSDAFFQQPLEWPRSVRAIYSDPLNVHKETGLAGRGTEEIKTNDVTGRFKPGHIGIAIEVGRPGVCSRLRELEKMSVALMKEGVEFEPKNPLTNLIDKETGKLPPEILDEKVISAIIEISVPKSRFLEIIRVIEETATTMDTVFSLDVASCRVGDTWEAEELLSEAGIYYRPNAKINLGLGKPPFVSV
jgi:NAD-dependent dihydropyrimidine dehydrogenase PreA subunit